MGCGKTRPKPELLRVVASDGEFHPDAMACRSGRGAWVCRNRECVARAVSRGAFARALKVRGTGVGGDGLAERLFAAIG